MITPAGYVCDSCGLLITKERRGLVHATETLGGVHGEDTGIGFAFFRWHTEAAKTMGHVHDDHECISVQVEKYLISFRWGRLTRYGNSHILARRREPLCDIT